MSTKTTTCTARNSDYQQIKQFIEENKSKFKPGQLEILESLNKNSDHFWIFSHSSSNNADFSGYKNEAIFKIEGQEIIGEISILF